MKRRVGYHTFQHQSSP